MATINLADLVSQSQTGYKQGIEDTIGLNADLAARFAERGVIANKAGDAAALVESTDHLAQAKAQEQALEYATKLGTNPQAETEILSSLISDKAQLFQQSRAELREIHRKQRTSLFSDPLGWLQAQFTLSDSVENYNAAATEHNLVSQQIDTLVSGTKEIEQMTNALAQTKTVASAEAAAVAARSTADLLANQSAIEALKTNADGIVRVQSMQQNALSNAFRIRDQQMQERSHALAVRNSNLAFEQHKLALEGKKEQQQERERTVQAVNLYRKANGMPEMSWTDLQLMYRDPQQKGLIDQQIVGGLTIAQSGGRYLADSPADALALASTNRAQLDPARDRLLRLTADQMNVMRANPDPNIKNNAQFAEALNTQVKAKAVNDHKLIQSSDNIYAPPSLETLLADKAIAATPSAQKVLAPLLSSGVREFNPTQAIPLIFEAVKKGEIPFNRAIADIQFIAGKSIDYNNALYSYKNTIGIDNQSKLNVKLETTGAVAQAVNIAAQQNSGIGGLLRPILGGTSTKVVDISNPAELQDYANRYMSTAISSSMRQQAQQAGR